MNYTKEQISEIILKGLYTHFPYIPLCVSGGQLSLVAHSTCWGMRGDREHFSARLFGRKGKIITLNGCLFLFSLSGPIPRVGAATRGLCSTEC